MGGNLRPQVQGSATLPPAPSWRRASGAGALGLAGPPGSAQPPTSSSLPPGTPAFPNPQPTHQTHTSVCVCMRAHARTHLVGYMIFKNWN